MMRSEELARRVEEAVDELPFGVVVVFGSRSRDTARSDSDLDVAVLPTARAEVDRRRLQARAASVLADLAPGGRVDVVFLDEAPELLRQRIMETGRVVVCREPGRWRELRVRTMREHADREPYRRLLREAQHRRLTEGGDGRSGRAVGSPERARGLPR